MDRADKLKAISTLLEQWMAVYEEGKDLKCFFADANLKRVGIYGYGILGRHLHKVLVAYGIEVVCILDRKAESIACHEERKELFLHPDTLTKAMEVECIIITAVDGIEEIERFLTDRHPATVVTLKEVLEYAQWEKR